MFTVGSIILLTLLAWRVDKYIRADRSDYERKSFDDRQFLLLLHIRQDLKLIAFLIGGIMILLGVIADLK